MFTIKKYVKPSSLKEAYELLIKNKNNKILGGLLWMRLGRQNIHTAIDLQDLGLNQILETEETIEIGSMCTLRQIETHPLLQQFFNGVLPESVKNIVGVQFRNSATVGGSVYSRFGFSDLLTALMVLDTKVYLEGEGIVSLEDFINMPYKKDILIKLSISKSQNKACYLSERITQTDFPLITVAVSKEEGSYKIAVGARPGKVRLAYEAMALLNGDDTDLEMVARRAVDELTFGSNMRASADYRKQITKVLIKRAIDNL